MSEECVHAVSVACMHGQRATLKDAATEELWPRQYLMVYMHSV